MNILCYVHISKQNETVNKVYIEEKNPLGDFVNEMDAKKVVFMTFVCLCCARFTEKPLNGFK